ncbi:hypothetical protein AB0H86_34245 [Streptomyces sp. NPDC050997]
MTIPTDHEDRRDLVYRSPSELENKRVMDIGQAFRHSSVAQPTS